MRFKTADKIILAGTVSAVLAIATLTMMLAGYR
jgi:hypothetical protein